MKDKNGTQPPASDCPLLARTIELVKTCGRSPAVLAQETGLTFYWIHSLRYKPEVDPSVSKIVKLYEHLSGKKLEIH